MTEFCKMRALRFKELSGLVGIILLAGVSLENGTALGQTTNTDAVPLDQALGKSSGESFWEGQPGQGFQSTVQTVGVEAGGVAGFAAFGSRQAHDLALMHISYGHMLGHVVGAGHWYRGNWELRGELFGGAEFRPSNQWLIGLTPHLRYNWATGTRFIPFIDGGAGVTATGIGPPDLSNTFEFNLQGALGVHWFAGEHIAVTAEARYLHLSCAGISHPNLGLNGVMGLVGLTYFF